LGFTAFSRSGSTAED